MQRDGLVLSLQTPEGYLDFPGGRIDESEIDTAAEIVLRREIAEELGSAVRFEVRDIAFAAKRSFTRSDGSYNNVMALHYDVRYLSGEINLSDEHNDYQWIEPTKLINEPTRFVSSDEYEQFSNYFSKKGNQ